MNISIIIGLLIALVIICATTIVNNLINKEYRALKDKWDNRTTAISRILYDVSKLDSLVSDVKLKSHNIDTMTLHNLTKIEENLSGIVDSIENYEYRNF